MSKLMVKFVAGLAVILAAVTALSLYVNQNFIGRYFLYLEKRDMNRICDSLLSREGPMEEAVRSLEEGEDVVIAWVEGQPGNERLNLRIREAFEEKGIGIRKYWLWEQDQQDAMRNGRKMRLYRQDKLHYSLLVEYLSTGDGFLAVAKVIPSVSRTLDLVNRVSLAIFSGAGVVLLLLISFLVRRITSPLKTIGETAKAIAGLDFRTLKVHTGDELEDLAHDINHMSLCLKEAHGELEQKNRQMEELLANVSHDLKTPVSLIKAYVSGMRDGLDDGTFLDTIEEQNGRMEQMIGRLLDLAKVRREEQEVETVDMSRCLEGLIWEHSLQAGERGLAFRCVIEPSLTVRANRDAIRLILSNLLSNAVKYAREGEIRVTLSREADGVWFHIGNQADFGERFDEGRLWDPFYVAEPSRNSEMAGTGLGLSIVKAAAERHGYACRCEVKGDAITFSIGFGQ